MRLLSVVRLSVETDETTAPERQRAKNGQYAEQNGHTIIGEAQDLDVSARKVDPWKRPALGPWLNDADKRAQWDGLIFSRQDRIARSSLDWHKLVKWLAEYDKTMICLDPMADLTTASGRFVAGVIAGFGEMEADTIAARVKEAYTALHAAGQYAGGQVPFGYMPVKLEPKGWGFIPDPEYAPVVAEMASRYLGGESLHMIAAWLNDQRIPTSRNVVRRRAGKPELPSEWKSTSVRKVLSSPAITGAMTSNGDVLRGADGMAVMRAEPLISREDFLLIQKRLKANSDRTGPRINSSPLLRVAYCGLCGGVMYTNQTTTAGKVYRYYECANARDGKCSAKKLRAEQVEGALECAILGIGSRKMTRKIPHAASDNTEEHQQITEAIHALADKFAAGEMSATEFTTAMERWKGRREELKEEEKKEATKPREDDWEETAETIYQHYKSVQKSGDLNAFLRDKGVKIYVRAGRRGVNARTEMADLNALATV
jgi:site-specific DNA recombinase